jgi:hypothetical protein
MGVVVRPRGVARYSRRSAMIDPRCTHRGDHTPRQCDERERSGHYAVGHRIPGRNAEHERRDRAPEHRGRHNASDDAGDANGHAFADDQAQDA